MKADCHHSHENRISAIAVLVFLGVLISPLALYAGSTDGVGGLRYTIDGEGGSNTIQVGSLVPGGGTSSGPVRITGDTSPLVAQAGSPTRPMPPGLREIVWLSWSALLGRVLLR